ncbi:hypothetical protein M9H77_01346 [Catharanthus roseus]|uniref:Uncharacterized protein n=1 Tax=Catharanthus roseus TaxID=4058 RepID=A0ACC0C5B6_CATRO|nr:hypothetical protein M9H77_01346 [Catharanthus roseus]
MEKVKLSCMMMKNTWGEYGKFMRFERDVDTNGFSWHQRNYKCSFCSKEFKSAQALGGHMNVHRRERAKMRVLLLPTPTSSSAGDDHDQYSANPNPNPNILLDSYSTSSSSSSAPADAVSNMGKSSLNKRTFTEEISNFQFMTKRKESSAIVWKKKDIVRVVDLNISFLRRDAKAKEDVDLELRLGQYSNSSSQDLPDLMINNVPN